MSPRSYSQLLTACGPAAIAVVRFAGDAAPAFLATHVRTSRGAGPPDGIEAQQVFKAALIDTDGAALDDILVSHHARTDGVEWRLHLHGSPWIINRCLELLALAGLPQSPGPLPPIWPHDDALDADAHAALGHILTNAGARWLLSNVSRLRAALQTLIAAPNLTAGRAAAESLLVAPDMLAWYNTPLRIAVIGPPNAGKSTLVNALVGRSVSIVSPIPGTTRDWVEAHAETAGFPIAWLDTAGVRDSTDPLEAASVAQTRRMIDSADAALIVLDAAAPASAAEFVHAYASLRPVAVALNKADATDSIEPVRAMLPGHWSPVATPISAANATGLDALLAPLPDQLNRTEAILRSPTPFTDTQRALLRRAVDGNSLTEFRAALTAITRQQPSKP